jgi:hypothetical protein
MDVAEPYIGVSIRRTGSGEWLRQNAQGTKDIILIDKNVVDKGQSGPHEITYENLSDLKEGRQLLSTYITYCIS